MAEAGNEQQPARDTRAIERSLIGDNRRRGAMSIELLIARINRSRGWRHFANSAHREIMSRARARICVCVLINIIYYNNIIIAKNISLLFSFILILYKPSKKFFINIKIKEHKFNIYKNKLHV